MSIKFWFVHRKVLKTNLPEYNSYCIWCCLVLLSGLESINHFHRKMIFLVPFRVNTLNWSYTASGFMFIFYQLSLSLWTYFWCRQTRIPFRSDDRPTGLSPFTDYRSPLPLSLSLCMSTNEPLLGPFWWSPKRRKGLFVDCGEEKTHYEYKSSANNCNGFLFGLVFPDKCDDDTWCTVLSPQRKG